ncbi:MAG: hypothetical protein Q8O55_07450 [Dehalococcoidales bacterium]|nr:hypothetical protein [Dehalococcoidales bacterium]
MRQGTVSVLIGCHSPVHSYYVWKAWRKLYGKWPSFRETGCIAIHDIGHWGKDYLTDYEQKKRHWELGARVAKRLFGEYGYRMVAGHCEYAGIPLSPLYKADKYSWALAPYWWLMTHRTTEPKLARSNMKRSDDVRKFMKEVRENVESGTWASTHSIWMRSQHVE